VGNSTTSKYKGVFWCRRAGRFRARIVLNRKQFYLGTFHNEEDAARAYNAKAIELFGKFAYLNSIAEFAEEGNPRTIC
jgi:hypothetical protein